jgi:response regulator of citrate/malate metabolism
VAGSAGGDGGIARVAEMKMLDKTEKATPALAKTRMAYQAHLDDPEYWRDRAEQLRTLANGISNQTAREAILRIAADCELLAHRAQERANLLGSQDTSQARRGSR